MTDQSKNFKKISRESLPFPVGSNKNFQWCPTMDLISFQFNENTLWVYRLGNQRVWTIQLDLDTETGEPEDIESLCWRPDGKIFAILSVKGSVSLFDSNNGQLVLKFKLENSFESCNWFSRSLEFESTLNKFEHLFEINLSNSLTKLSSSHSSKKMISDNELIKCDNSSLDFLIIGSEGGTISIILYGIFTIENFRLKFLENSYSTILSIESTKDLIRHYILVENEGGLSVIRLDTTFVEIYGTLLPTVSLTCSKIVGLLAYTKDLIDGLISECKPFIDYTSRIIALLKGEIEEKSGDDRNFDPIYDLYDLLLTGIMSEPTKTWLTDYLGDRGIKRWTKLSKQYFDGSRKNMFYNLIPALEHILIHLSKLQGLAKWRENEQQLGLHETKLSESIEIASNLLKLFHRLIIKLNNDQRNFESFLRWLNSIFIEVTTDEKDNEPIKTKEIIQFLTDGLNKAENNDETITLFKYLESKCDEVFDSIKQSMKLRMESTSMSKISDIGSNGSTFKLLETTNGSISLTAGLIMVYRDDSMELVHLNPTDLTSSKKILTFNDLITSRYETSKITSIQGEIIAMDQFILSINFKHGSSITSNVTISLDINTILGLDDSIIDITEEYILKRDVYPDQEKFIPSYLSVNPLRKIACLLDAAKKDYIVIEI